jgi:hypothetical protein
LQIEIGHNGGDGIFVVLTFGHLQQFIGIGQGIADARQQADDLLQLCPLLTQLLGTLGVVPDIRNF